MAGRTQRERSRSNPSMDVSDFTAKQKRSNSATLAVPSSSPSSSADLHSSKSTSSSITPSSSSSTLKENLSPVSSFSSSTTSGRYVVLSLSLSFHLLTLNHIMSYPTIIVCFPLSDLLIQLFISYISIFPVLPPFLLSLLL